MISCALSAAKHEFGLPPLPPPPLYNNHCRATECQDSGQANWTPPPAPPYICWLMTGHSAHTVDLRTADTGQPGAIVELIPSKGERNFPAPLELGFSFDKRENGLSRVSRVFSCPAIAKGLQVHPSTQTWLAFIISTNSLTPPFLCLAGRPGNRRVLFACYLPLIS